MVLAVWIILTVPFQEEQTMATAPIQRAAPALPAETLEQRFRRLEAAWLADTKVLSSYTRIVNHPAFGEIVSLGDAVIPIMLRDLDKRPSLWVWALPRITGENPVNDEDAGNIAKMTQAWLQWARGKGYKW
jgi:hypothetical protein